MHTNYGFFQTHQKLGKAILLRAHVFVHSSMGSISHLRIFRRNEWR